MTVSFKPSRKREACPVLPGSLREGSPGEGRGYSSGEAVSVVAAFEAIRRAISRKQSAAADGPDEPLLPGVTGVGEIDEVGRSADQSEILQCGRDKEVVDLPDRPADEFVQGYRQSLDPEESVQVGAGEVRVDEDDLVPVEGEGAGGVRGDQALADTPLPATDRADEALDVPHGIDGNTVTDCRKEKMERSADLRCNTGKRISSIGWNHTVANAPGESPGSPPTHLPPFPETSSTLNKPPPPRRFIDRGEKHLTPRFGGRPRRVRQ